jgi:hypothetical protein
MHRLFVYPAVSVAGLLGLPLIGHAQTLGKVSGFIVEFGNIVELLLPITITIAVLYFFWGLAQFILNSGSDDAKAEGRNKMIWGVIALFVIVSVWGIINFLGELFGVGQGGTAPVPGVQDTEDSVTGLPSFR